MLKLFLAAIGLSGLVLGIREFIDDFDDPDANPRRRRWLRLQVVSAGVGFGCIPVILLLGIGPPAKWRGYVFIALLVIAFTSALVSGVARGNLKWEEHQANDVPPDGAA